jgi:hypothetical protein
VTQALNLHRNTVRNWVRPGGLPAMSGSRPHLILGAVLVEFIKARRTAVKRKCGPGEIYCLRCRAPRKPVAELMESSNGVRPNADCSDLLALREADTPLRGEGDFARASYGRSPYAHADEQGLTRRPSGQLPPSRP